MLPPAADRNPYYQPPGPRHSAGPMANAIEVLRQRQTTIAAAGVAAVAAVVAVALLFTTGGSAEDNANSLAADPLATNSLDANSLDANSLAADNETGETNDPANGTGDESPDALAAASNNASNDASQLRRTPSSATTPATAAPTTAAPTTAAPTTATPTTAAPTTAAPTTAAPTTAAPTTAAPTTAAPTTAAPTTAAPTTVAPTTAAQVPAPDASMAQQILTITNKERAAAGCGALTLNSQLNQAAQAHSEDMANRGYFSHTSPEGGSPGDRIDATGYQWRAYGENIAAGYGSAQAVMNGWMNSPGHRANILNCGFTQLGVGYVAGSNHYTQVFGTPR